MILYFGAVAIIWVVDYGYYTTAKFLDWYNKNPAFSLIISPAILLNLKIICKELRQIIKTHYYNRS